MQSEVMVRKLQADDVSRFRELRLKALRDAPTAFASSYEEDAALSEESLRARLDAGPSAVFGAFAGETLVGMAGFFALSGPKRRHRGLLWGVFVDAGQRGRGLARQLVERVIRHAGQHVRILEAGVTAGNDSAAALYDSLGFQVIGRLPKALLVEDCFHDEILLARELERQTG